MFLQICWKANPDIDSSTTGTASHIVLSRFAMLRDTRFRDKSPRCWDPKKGVGEKN